MMYDRIPLPNKVHADFREKQSFFQDITWPSTAITHSVCYGRDSRPNNLIGYSAFSNHPSATLGTMVQHNTFYLYF